MIKVWEDHCTWCGSRNERRLNTETGECVVLLPTRCKVKDICEERIVRCDRGANRMKPEAI